MHDETQSDEARAEETSTQNELIKSQSTETNASEPLIHATSFESTKEITPDQPQSSNSNSNPSNSTPTSNSNPTTSNSTTEQLVHKGKTADEIAEAYKSEPWWYDVRGFFILTFAYNSTLPTQLNFFGPNFGTNHLEVACGTGTLLSFILSWRKRRKLPLVQLVGVDYAESMLAGARHRFPKKKHPNMTFLHADAAAMPLESNHFDTVNVANAVHCFPDVDGAFRDILRVLKPGGTLAANVLLYPRGIWPFKQIATRINNWGMKKGILYTPYEQEDVKQRLINAGFEIVSERVQGNCYNVFARKPESAAP